MKKTTFKIKNGLRYALLAASFLTFGWGMHATKKPASSYASLSVIGLVAGMKKKGIDLSPEEEKTMLVMEGELNEAFELASKGMMSEKDFNEKLAAKELEIKGAMVGNQTFKDLEAKFDKLDEANRKQAETITQLKNEGRASIPDRKTIATELKAFFEANKEGLAAFRSGQSKSFGTDKMGFAGIELESKAAVTMTVGGSTNASAFVPGVQVIPGLIDLVRNKPFIEQYANTSNTNSTRIVWTEKYNPQGQAGFIGEGVVKPLISFEIRTSESYAKKVADKIKVSTEMLDDIDWMAAEIENELKYQVDIKVDAELLAGTGDGTNSATELKGLTQYVSGYVLTSIKTTTPNDQDAIRASIAQIVSLNYAPTALFYNPIDGANMDIVKDTQGRPLMAAYMVNGKLWNLQPVETNQIPVGYFLLGDMTRFKVANYKPFAIYMGWVNDDFEKNLVTIIGERRLHVYVATNDIGAFVYASFATVKTAITAS